MSLLIVLGALGFLMWVAYRGASVIVFAPVAALLAVLLSSPIEVAPAFSALFLERMADFLKSYFPVFLLGALFGKVIELSGFAHVIVAAVLRLLGTERAMPAVVLVCALLTYGGVSLFVVVFAVYPFAVELFRRTGIPRRLLPGTIALGAFTFTMDSLPGTPQIQNVIPTTFFGTTTWAAPVLGSWPASSPRANAPQRRSSTRANSTTNSLASRSAMTIARRPSGATAACSTVSRSTS
jgi:H+/gluconate symporter-like permease